MMNEVRDWRTMRSIKVRRWRWDWDSWSWIRTQNTTWSQARYAISLNCRPMFSTCSCMKTTKSKGLCRNVLECQSVTTATNSFNSMIMEALSSKHHRISSLMCLTRKEFATKLSLSSNQGQPTDESLLSTYLTCKQKWDQRAKTRKSRLSIIGSIRSTSSLITIRISHLKLGWTPRFRLSRTKYLGSPRQRNPFSQMFPWWTWNLKSLFSQVRETSHI